jgi:hypothetical protein
VALSFPDLSAVVLAVMHALKEPGAKPEPERQHTDRSTTPGADPTIGCSRSGPA